MHVCYVQSLRCNTPRALEVILVCVFLCVCVCLGALNMCTNENVLVRHRLIKVRAFCSRAHTVLTRSSFLPSSPPAPPGAACGWLIMPSWFYARKDALQDAQESLYTSPHTVRSARSMLPRAATASLRSKAHRRNAHELNTKEVIKSAARRLLRAEESEFASGSGSGSGSGSPEFDQEDVSFLARLSFM